jgi:hydrogenase-4 component F
MLIYALIALPLAAAALTALTPRSGKVFIEYGALGAALLEVAAALGIASGVLTGGVVSASAIFQADALSAFVASFIALVGLAAAMHSIGHLREEVRKEVIGFRRVRQYFVLFHLFFFAMFSAAVTASPVLMWAAVEATTLASAFLVTFYNKPSALEAGWKFLIINSVGLLLGFLGTLLFLAAAGGAGASGAFVTWSTLLGLSAALNPLLLKIAFVFVLVGFGTKVGFVPMHTWLPDAHSKAPVPISALLSGVLLNIALVGILRFRTVVDATVDPAFTSSLLIGFGIVSLMVAAFIIYVQKNYKRLLAYSSIEHMGVIALGFGVGGAGVFFALFHMLYHALLKPILFFSAGNFFLKYSSTKIAQVRGALSVVPVSAVLFFAALLAVAGVPPSGIFFTELGILSAGIGSHPYVMMLMLAGLLIIFAGFIRHGSAMLFGEAPSDIPRGEVSNWTVVSIAFLFVVFAAVSFAVPASLTALISHAAALIN